MKEKNVNNLTKTLAVMTLLVPVTAHPLGIGDIELHSALNQKLDAQVRLHLSGENPSDINVRLAAPEKFDQAGIPWSYFLSKLKFEPVLQSNGSVIVKITSKDALTEPFLNFLLEVSWPQGNLFREFTLLIDPPADYQSPSLPIASSDSSSQTDDWQAREEKPAKKARKSPKRTTVLASSITPETPTSGEYGPTRNQDTLWGIAQKLGKERGIGNLQLMEALFKANPGAFNRGDRDALKAGVSLRIPETEAILSQTAGLKPHKPSTNDKPGTSTNNANRSLELVAPVEAKVTENASLGEPVNTSGGNDVTGAGHTQGSASGKDLELQTRIEKLEQQLNMMQQLLALKDQQLASLQNKDQSPASTTPGTIETAPQVAPSPTVTPNAAANGEPTTPTPTVAPQPTIEPPKPVPTPPKPQVTTPPVAEEEPSSYYLTVGGVGASILGLLGWLWLRKRKIEEQTNTDSMFASASQIRMPDSDGGLSVPVMDMSSAASYDVGTVGESSFISDFSPSDFDAFDSDQGEVDPMSEADVYLAYGRYQQAEELIRNAIREQPARDDYKLKLFEILYANESKESFVNFAQELSNEGKQSNSSFWAKVSEMGKELAPESVLFGGTASEKADTRSDSTEKPIKTTNDDIADFDIPKSTVKELAGEVASDFSSAESKLAPPETETTAKNLDNGLDFDLSDFDNLDADTKLKNDAKTTTLESIDFDLSTPSLDSSKTETQTSVPDEPVQAESLSDELEQFDFNFDLDTVDEKPSPNKDTVKEPVEMDTLESFEFPDFATAAEEPSKNLASEAKEQTSNDNLGDFDFNFDFDSPVTTKDEEEDMDFGVADLTDMDEFETKIDLAKAYIDMGDNDAAKSIAEEVLAKGSKEQKIAAQAILDDLE